MVMLILLILLIVVVTLGATRLESRKSSVRMMNADWLGDVEKFRLISRWGVME